VADSYEIILNDGVSLPAKRAADAAAKLDTSLRNAGKGAKKAKKDTDDFSYALNGIATKMADMAFNLAGKFVSSVVDIGESLHDTAKLASRTKLSFATMFGGVAEGAKVTESGIAMSKKYGFALEDVLGSISRFSGAGFNLPQIETLISMQGDLRGLGRTTEQINRLGEAMVKIKNSGKLEGDEMQVLSENGVNIGKLYESLALKLGKTTDEIKAMKKAGKIPADAALNSIGESILLSLKKSKVGQAGEAAANETLDGLEGKLKAEMGSRIFSAVDAAEPALVKGMQAIFKGAMGSGTLDFEGALTHGLEKLGFLMEQLGPKLPAIADAFAKAFGAASGINFGGLNDFVGKLPQIASGLGTVAGQMSVLVGWTFKLVNGLSMLMQLMPGSGAGEPKLGKDVPLDQMGDPAAVLRNKQLDWEDKNWGNGAAAAEGLAKGMKDNQAIAEAASAQLAQATLDAQQRALGIHSPSKKFAEQGMYIDQGLALGIEDHAQLAMNASAELGSDAVAASSGAIRTPDAAAAASIGAQAGNSAAASGSRSVGDVHVSISVDGSTGASDTVAQIREFFDTELAALFERQLEGSGA
jgi:tape measure domain-containing protein